MNFMNNRKRLTDRGWSQMRQMLDREMPVRQRRPIIWWWLAAAFLLGCLSSALYLQRLQRKPIVYVPVPQTVYVTKEISTPNSNNKAGNTSTTQVTLFSMTQSNLSSRAFSRQMQTNFPAFVLPETRFWAKGDLQANQNTVEALLPPTELTAEVPDLSAFLLENPVCHPVYESLSNKNNPLALADPRDVMGVNVDIDRKRDYKPLVFGINAAIATERFQTINRASAGVFVDYQPLRQFGLRLGLGYQHALPSAHTRPLAPITAADYMQATGYYGLIAALRDSSGQYPVNPSSTVVVPVSRLHRIEAPISLYWAPAGRLRLYSGVVVQRIFQAKTSGHSFIEDADVVVQNGYRAARMDEVVSRRIDRWSFDWMAGVGMRIFPRFELGFAYRENVQSKSSIEAQKADIISNPDIREGLMRVKRPQLTLSGTMFF